MSNRSRVTEEKQDHIVIHGPLPGHPGKDLARLSFHRYGHSYEVAGPFILHLAVLSSIVLAEETARAFADHILKQCDKVKAGRSNSNE